MNYYDQTFEPWKIVDGQCVVADEAEWQKLEKWNLEYDVYCQQCGEIWDNETCKDHDNPRPIIKVPTDIFEVRGLPVTVSNGGRAWMSRFPDEYQKGSPWLGTFSREINETCRWVGVGDLIDRFFQTVDATPQVDYLLMTQRPELVREKWPCPSCKGMSSPRDGHGGCDGCQGDAVGSGRRSNVILATYVETQSDIERLVPNLLKCHDLCKGLAVVCNPKEELDLSSAGPKCQLSGADPNAGIPSDSLGLDLVIAEGNEHPIHPDWLRSLRDQCLDANVEFNLASWGEWVPRENCPNGLDDGKGLENLCHYETHEGWVSGLTTAKNQHMVRVGKDKSGRLLNGDEHNGRIQ